MTRAQDLARLHRIAGMIAERDLAAYAAAATHVQQALARQQALSRALADCRAAISQSADAIAAVILTGRTEATCADDLARRIREAEATCAPLADQARLSFARREALAALAQSDRQSGKRGIRAAFRHPDE
jgi:hypothetical protein